MIVFLKNEISQSLTDELEAIENESVKLISSQYKEQTIKPELLLSQLSYTHFIELIRFDDPSVDIIRDLYFLEFLGLEERPEYSESELEEAILNHLQQFMIELGTGFCFEARQKRITFDNTHYRIDLVFYHRILKSHILIDLKIGKFDHAGAGQMNVYLNYYKDNEMSEGDNPPIGLILCGSKNEALAKYATSGMDNQLFVSKYLIRLPEKKVLEELIKRELAK